MEKHNKLGNVAIKIVAVVIAGVITIGLSGCASCSRAIKDWNSDTGGGLDRTIVLYDYSGNEIQRWSGKVDVDTSTDNTVTFDLDGKRTIIDGGIVVIQEQ